MAGDVFCSFFCLPVYLIRFWYLNTKWCKTNIFYHRIMLFFVIEFNFYLHLLLGSFFPIWLTFFVSLIISWTSQCLIGCTSLTTGQGLQCSLGHTSCYCLLHSSCLWTTNLKPSSGPFPCNSPSLFSLWICLTPLFHFTLSPASPLCFLIISLLCLPSCC